MINVPRIPYSRVKKDGRRYFGPTPKMKAMGFEARPLGIEGPEARAEAWHLYEAFRTAKITGTTSAQKVYPIGSIGFAFERYRRTEAWAKKSAASRKKDWDWSWQFIEPIFGDVDPKTVQVENVERFRTYILQKRGHHTAHRVIKVWRALWKIMAAMQYCERDGDPSLIIRNSAPKGRSTTWKPREIAAIVKRAWREEFRGLAALLSVAYDTQLSPGDCRMLSPQDRFRDARGTFFETARGKTGRPIIGTLSRRSVRILDAYLKQLGADLAPSAPIFRNRRGRPYSSDTLGDDFRTIREMVFPGDTRNMLDIRRSGAVEAVAGDADPAAMAAKMGNTIDHNRFLQETYLPNKTATIRKVDEARRRGRQRLRENEE